MNITIPVVKFLENASIEALVELIAEQWQKTLPASNTNTAHQQKEDYPLSHDQQALWFVHQHAKDSAAYHVAATLRICSKVDI